MSATWIRLGAALALTTFAACATVTRKSDRPLDAEIVGGSTNNVFFAQPDGTECRVPRSDIASIHYPGTIPTVLGLLVGAWALFHLGENDWRCKALRGGDCVALIVPAPLSLALLVPGVVAVNRSMAREASTSRPDADPSPVPICQSPPPPPLTARPQGRAWAPAAAVPSVTPFAAPPAAAAPPITPAAQPVPTIPQPAPAPFLDEP